MHARRRGGARQGHGGVEVGTAISFAGDRHRCGQAEGAQRVGIGHGVGRGHGAGQRRAEQRVAAAARGRQAEQAVQRGVGTPEWHAAGIARRRRGRARGREGVPVGGNLPAGRRARRGRRPGLRGAPRRRGGRGRRRREGVGEGVARAAGKRPGAKQRGERIVARCRCGGCLRGCLDAQQVGPDQQILTAADRRLLPGRERHAVDADGVAATVDQQELPSPAHHLDVDARDGLLGVRQHQRVGVGPADGATGGAEAGGEGARRHRRRR